MCHSKESSEMESIEIPNLLRQLVEVDQGLLFVTQDPDRNMDSIARVELKGLEKKIFISNCAVVLHLWENQPQLFKNLPSSAYHDLWLIAQHSDHNIKMQKLVLDILQKFNSKDSVNDSDIAYLRDRILVNEGKPQLYGTQVTFNESGVAIPKPIANVNEVDKRRSQVKLGPLSDYLEFMTLRNRKSGENVTINITRN